MFFKLYLVIKYGSHIWKKSEKLKKHEFEYT